ncbi:hypothetical protein B0O80DRAFT_255569 [Mortierella sp. GBAus27b]|nr:hypothetical protein B0O80DRAFT_255569 [Mortierella sp. GBAus27b]
MVTQLTSALDTTVLFTMTTPKGQPCPSPPITSHSSGGKRMATTSPTPYPTPPLPRLHRLFTRSKLQLHHPWHLCTTTQRFPKTPIRQLIMTTTHTMQQPPIYCQEIQQLQTIKGSRAINCLTLLSQVILKPHSGTVIWKLFKVLVVFTIAYLALMSLYFAAEYNSSSRLENIDILVVDLDHSIIGNHFLNFTQQDNKLPGQVNWSIQVGYENEEEVIEDVENGYYWGAMVVRANASLMLNKGLSTPLPSYDPRKAFLFVYDGGRDPLTVKPYVIASLYTQFLQFTTNFNLAWIILVLTVAGDHVDSITPLVDAPQVLGTPVAFEELDVHPPTAPIITSATSVAYIWIFLIAGGSTYLVANAVQPLTRKASVRKTMVLLLVPLLVFLSSLSMVYTVVLRIFGVPFHSAGQFVSLFLSMLLVQASVSSLVLFLVFFIPVIFIPAITTTFVFMNVIAVFHPVELMPPFYRWAYAMPFLNAVQLARYVLMGSYNRLIYNLPILFAWIIVPLTLLPLAIARQKRLMKEVLELEEDERQDNKSRRYSSGKDRKYDDYGYTKDTGISKRRRRSHENSDSSQSDDEDDLESASGSCYRCRRRHHHHHGQRRLDRMDDEDYDNENEEEDEEDDGYAEDLAVIEHNAAVMNAARSIRPLNSSGMLTSGATPSAPPASQVLETHQLHQQQQQHHRSSNDHQRSLLETLQLSRHPYASELVQTQALDEVK